MRFKKLISYFLVFALMATALISGNMLFNVITTGAATEPVEENCYYNITNLSTGRLMDVDNGSDADGTMLHTWTMNNSNAQQYSFVKASVEGYYVIVPKCTTTRAIDNPNASTEVGTCYQLYTQNNTDAQLFRLESDGAGNYRIINKKSGMALADMFKSDGSDDGTKQQVIGNFKNQLWKISKVADSYTFINPIKPDGADPWVIQAGNNYYLCYSNGDKKIYIRRMSDFEDMRTAKDTLIYTAPDTGNYCAETWAPELFYLNGRWYVYYAADNGTNANHRMYVLEGGTNPNDPLDGAYTFKSKIYDASNDRWAIDGTVFEYGGNMYFVWSGWAETNGNIQNLYIASMSNPWTLSSSRVCISQPTNSWEFTGSSGINEGPEVLIKDNKVHIIYSAAGSWADNYCLARLTCTDGNFLNASSWVKSTEPLFQKSDNVFGVGHASFVKSKDGTEDWIIYHAAQYSGAGWSRNIRAQLFRWTADGYPYFGEPVDQGVSLSRPSDSFTPAVNTTNYYKIVNVGTGRVLDIADGADGNGVKVQTWTNNNSSAQRFRFMTTNDTGWYVIVPKCAQTRAIDNPSSSKEKNKPYQLYTRNSTIAQKFKLEYMGDGKYRIVNMASLFALTDASELTGGYVEQRVLQNSDYQLWEIVCMENEEGYEAMTPVTVSEDDTWVSVGAWSYYFGSWNSSNGAYKGGAAADNFTLNVTANNKAQWGIQIALDNQPVTAGHTYRYILNVTSDAAGSILSKDDASNSNPVTTSIASGANTIEGTFTASGNKAKILLELASGIDVGTTLKFTGFSLADITESISLDKNSLSLVVGDNANVKATVEPAGTVYTWETSNASVATVSAGVITATGAGSATITARTSGGKTAVCIVTVTAPVVVQDLSIEGLTAEESGGKITVTATAFGGVGTVNYWFCIIGDGKIYAKSTAWNSSNTFVTDKPDGNYTIRVYCKDSAGAKCVKAL